MQSQYDIIIVGAGPTGSLAGHLLAKTGLHVLIIEKVMFPREKLCGGGVSLGAVQLLNDVIDLKGIPHVSPSGSYLSFRDEHLTYVTQDVTSYSVNRTDLDNAILRAARSEGCDVLMPAEVIGIQEQNDGVVVTVRGDRKIRGAYLILADGANGRLQRTLGYRGHREVTMALKVDVTPGFMPDGLKQNMLFDFGAIPLGYAWIFPKNSFFNIGAYWYRSHRIARTQIQALQRFINQFEWGRDGRQGQVKGFPIPRVVGFQRFNTARTLLAGDAVGAVENLYGEGLAYGLQSSYFAADTIREAVRHNRRLDPYTARLRSEILSQMKFSRITAHQFYRHARFGYYSMVRSRLLNAIYAKLIHGIVSQRKALFETAALLPVSMLGGTLPEAAFEDVGMLRRRTG